MCLTAISALTTLFTNTSLGCRAHSPLLEHGRGLTVVRLFLLGAAFFAAFCALRFFVPLSESDASSSSSPSSSCRYLAHKKQNPPS